MRTLVIILGAIGAICGIITWILVPWVVPGEMAGPFPAIALILLGAGLVLVGLRLRG